MPLATGGKSLPPQEAAAPVLAVTPEATECSTKELPSQPAAASVPPARPASKLFNLDSAMLPEKVRKAVPTSHYPLLDSLIVIERTPLRGSDIREVPVIPEDIVSDAGLEAAAPVSETCMPDCAAVHGGTDIRENPAVPVETTHSVLAHPEGTALVREQVPAEEKPADEHTAGNTAAVDIPAQDDSPEPVQESRPVPQRVSAAAVQEPALVPDAAGTMQNPRTSSGAVAVQTKPASFDTKAQSVSGSSMQGYGVPPQYEPAAVGSESDEDLDDIEDETDEDTIGEDDGVFLEKTPSENIGSPLQPFPPVVSLDAAALPAAVPAAPRKKYSIPFDLLNHYPDGEYWVVDDATRKAAFMLKSTFSEFKIDVSITGIRKGPVVTMFEMLPPPGIKLSKITNLQDNIALRLAASSVRIVAPIPGKHAVGIEVPNKKRSIVSFRELIETDLPESAKMAIPVVLGKDVTGNPQLFDLAQTPHLLIAGATGSGKSVCVNTIILSILYNRRPDEVKLILVDPKIVELKLYNDIAHLLAPVITEPKRAFQALQYSLCEMERRYALLDSMGARDIKTYNKKIKAEKIAAEELPYIVVIIDEFADLMATSGKELEATVARLCAMSRAVGIHLVLATQRPSIDVITGLIKANIPTRIAFMVASKTDSRIILDEVGAEKLLGKGDMLYVSAAQLFPARMQGAFVSEEEVERVVACVKDYCEPEYIDDEIFVDDDDDSYEHVVFSDDNDPLYDQALEIVTFAGKASASYVQRKLKIGYNRAARLIEEMEANGIVGPANGSKPREILRR
ncbi:MAG: DNA translocase FtsK [Treponema sp.]